MKIWNGSEKMFLMKIKESQTEQIMSLFILFYTQL